MTYEPSPTGLYDLLNDQPFRSFVDHYARCEKDISGNEFLLLFDSFVKKHMSVPTSLTDSLRIEVPNIWESVDQIKTGRSHSEVLQCPLRLTVIALLCVLASIRSKVSSFKGAENGYMLRATIPADIWSYEGVAHVGLLPQDKVTLVTVKAEIKGQIFDWGKSKRWLTKLFTDLNIVCRKMQ